MVPTLIFHLGRHKATGEVLYSTLIPAMDDVLAGSTGLPRFRTAVILTFSILALFIASIGLYGVMSYVVSQRTQEFGVRIALGASRGEVARLVIAHAAKLLAIGMALGLAGSALLSKAITKLLFGVQPLDGATLAGVTALLALVGTAAAYVPARRAANSDPMESLRRE